MQALALAELYIQKGFNSSTWRLMPERSVIRRSNDIAAPVSLTPHERFPVDINRCIFVPNMLSLSQNFSFGAATLKPIPKRDF
jgi:hypothetical protein